jgi:hypothetical protein
MFNIIIYKGTTNQNNTDNPSHSSQNGYHKENRRSGSSGKSISLVQTPVPLEESKQERKTEREKEREKRGREGGREGGKNPTNASKDAGAGKRNPNKVFN